MRRLLANAILTFLLAASCIAALVGFGRVAPPWPCVVPATGVASPDDATIHREISESSIRADLEGFSRFGGRFTGGAGLEQARRTIRGKLAEHGCETIEQPVKVVVPVTRRARLLDDAGSPISGIEIHPMLPNRFRTVTTPPGGIRSRVLRAERGRARDFEGVDPEGQIVLLPEGESWDAVAAMGAAVVLYFERDDVEVDPRWPSHLRTSLDVPRFLVRGSIDALAGRTVTVEARVDWVEQIVHNVVGIIEPDAGSDETIVLTAYYDAHCYAPDLAVGANQSAGAAALLNIAGYLSKQKGLRRSIVLVFTPGHCQGLYGIRRFTDALGPRGRRADRLERHRERLARVSLDLERARDAASVASDDAYWSAQDATTEDAYWFSRDSGCRDEFEDRLADVLDDALLEVTDQVLHARLSWARAGRPVSRASEGADTFESFTRHKQRQRAVIAAQSVAPWLLKDRYRSLIADVSVRDRVAAEFRDRLGDLEFERTRTVADLAIARRLAPGEIALLGLDLTFGSGRLAMVCGRADRAAACRPADGEIAAQFDRAARGLTAAAIDLSYERAPDGRRRFLNLVPHRDVFDLPRFVATRRPGSLYLDASAMLHAGYTAFTLYTHDDDRRRLGTPRDTFDQVLGDDDEARRNLANLTIVSRLVASAAHRMALGGGRLLPTRFSNAIQDVPGRVVSQLGDSLVPSHRMRGALVKFFSLGEPERQFPPGVHALLMHRTDREGRFNLPAIWGETISGARAPELHLDAAVVRPRDGAVTWKLNTPMSAWGMPFQVKGRAVSDLARSPVTVVVFRATAIQMFPVPDPSTLGSFPGFGFVDSRTLTPPDANNVEQRSDEPGLVLYVPLESNLAFTFKKGTRTSPGLQQVRAFALNASGPADGSRIAPDAPEISGPGYVAAETPGLINVELDAALSMAQVNARRVREQDSNGLADRMLVEFNGRAVDLADRAHHLSQTGRLVEAKRTALRSLAYSAHVHPVTRRNAVDAIRGIVFYLFLTIPFVIFMEKLLIGHADIRYQIAGQVSIFVVVFVALRYLHPAYEVVRSPLVILLGFMTLALALMIGAFVTFRFSGNVVEACRRIQRRAEAIDVSRVEAAATAFTLGLNHLRKRPVRTGLTAITLVLVTFVMIGFTSVRNDVVDTRFGIGDAPYTGLLIRDAGLNDMTQSFHALQELYGHERLVVPRAWGGHFSLQYGEAPSLAALALVRRTGGDTATATAHAVLGLSPLESELLPIREIFEMSKRWIDNADEPVCYLPRGLADALRLSDEDIATGAARVEIEGRPYQVLGVFNEDRLDDLVDLDGESLLPVDIRRASTSDLPALRPASAEKISEAPEDLARLPARHVIITPIEAMPMRTRIASVAVALPDADYAEARAFIDDHLERAGQFAYFGLDGEAWYGGRLRAMSMHGLVNLILPILIAALTVFNTMHGSVYERRDELYVFNAVGLAPHHVQWLFFAEALVFAVIGAVGGYLLAQSVGAGLRGLDLAAGLAMNYSTMSAVRVTILIMIVVLASSLIPARIAARLAAPAETMTRRVETAEGDAIEVDLPFLFNRRDRVAVIAFLADWFDQYGEGSAGSFFCGPPVCSVRDDGQGGAVPVVSATTWHKPFDLGIRQEVVVRVQRDARTGDHVASAVMRRRSGDHHSWQRCCHAFIGHLRKRLLSWRGLDDEQRRLLLDQGRTLLGGGAQDR
ncbi:MAG: hypothetical protein CMJ18_00860 [Phycisphaeraceae bacterium]|nr:hypothetical protein [Phycisphaeraceae bacterium]